MFIGELEQKGGLIQTIGTTINIIRIDFHWIFNLRLYRHCPLSQMDN